MNPSLTAKPIPRITQPAQQQLFSVLLSEPYIQAVWLFGSRAMGRYQGGSDIDLCLEGAELTHLQSLRLMAAVDVLLLPWQVDLVLRHEMPPELEAHLQWVGQSLWPHQPGSRELRWQARTNLKAEAESHGTTPFEPSPETLIREDRSR